MEINNYTREAILPFLPLMNSWCSQQLKNYPYLYMPASEQIINPSDVMYVNDPNALLVVAKKDGDIISVATGISLNSIYLTSYYFPPDIIDKFKNNNYDPDKIWYMGYFLINPTYRDDRQLIHAIYQRFIAQMQKLGKTQISYVNVKRPDNHPLKPNNYRYPEPWDDVIGGFRNTNVTTPATWPTLQADGNVSDQEHEIMFFVKDV